MPGRTDSRVRLLALLCVFLVGALALGARSAYWQVVDHERLVTEAADQTTVTIETPSQRGDIFDRTGTIVLATTVQRDRLVAAPDQLTPDQRRATVTELAQLLELDDAAAIALRDKLNSKSRYLIIQHGIERQLADRIQAAIDNGRVFGLSLEPEPERVYPQPGGGPGTTLAAHLLGFVNRDGVGQYGVEQQYQAALGGSPRVVVAQRDATGRPILESADVTSAGQSGTDLRLTIDAGLQLRVEQELLAAWIADKAKRVSAIVMDPYTGEVYAMASYPSFDANDYKAIAATDPSRFIDPLVASVYEPGSVFKMMTATAALEAGTVTPSTMIKDIGTLRLDGGRTKIDDADRKGMGWMTFQDGVAYSRNVVAAKVALGLGPSTRASASKLYDTWLRLGYGKPTGIDVAGEVPGIVRDPAITPWREIDLANGAFGQGVAVTPIQLASAYATLMNGGIADPPARGQGHRQRRRGGCARPAGDCPAALQHPGEDDAARHRHGALLPRPDDRSRLRRGWQDRHRPDLGSEGQPRSRRLEGKPLQLLVRRLHRPRAWDPGPGRGHPDRGGDPDGREGRPPGDAGDVLRALPPDRDGRDRHARPAGRPAGDAGHDLRSVTPPCATLAAVTDVDPSTVAPGAADAPSLSSDELARLTGGRLLARSDRPIRGAAVDSRLVQPGELFVALPGERSDGHEFIPEAVARGAAGLLVTRPVPDPARLGDLTVVRVVDGTAALGALAAGWRRRFRPLVVGVTGSIAKTSAKEAIAAVLGARFNTLRNEGNQNNEIGLPLTLLRLGPEHEAAVLEMGMYVGGEIADLARIARPGIGVVTAVQPVHLARIGSLRAIEAAKGELLEALPPDGRAILNADDPIVRRMGNRSVARSMTYGFDRDADVGAEAVESAGLAGMRFVLRTDDGRRAVSIPTLGRLSVHNALAGAAVGRVAGLSNRRDRRRARCRLVGAAPGAGRHAPGR